MKYICTQYANTHSIIKSCILVHSHSYICNHNFHNVHLVVSPSTRIEQALLSSVASPQQEGIVFEVDADTHLKDLCVCMAMCRNSFISEQYSKQFYLPSERLQCDEWKGRCQLQPRYSWYFTIFLVFFFFSYSWEPNIYCN